MTPLLLLQANRFQDNGEKVTTHWLFALKFSGIILYLSGTEHLSNHSPLCLTHHSFVLFFSPTLFRRKKFNHSCTQRQCSLRDKIPDCVTKVRSDHKHSYNLIVVLQFIYRTNFYEKEAPNVELTKPSLQVFDFFYVVIFWNDYLPIT